MPNTEKDAFEVWLENDIKYMEQGICIANEESNYPFARNLKHKRNYANKTLTQYRQFKKEQNQ